MQRDFVVRENSSAGPGPLSNRGGRTQAGAAVRLPPQRVVMVEFPPAGGLFQFTVQLGEALARRGHPVNIVTGPRPELRSREDGCAVRPILPTWHPAAGSDSPSWWRRARRGLRAGQYATAWVCLLAWLKRSQPDVVLWSAWRFPLDGWGVRLVRRVLPEATLGLVAHEPRPLVEQPGGDGHYKSDPTLHDALSPAYRELDAVFTLGGKAAEVLRQTWPVTVPVTVIPHGDEGVFAEGARDAVVAVEDTPARVLFFGTITGYKGIQDLLACWPAVRRDVPQAELVIAGNVGADIDRDELERTVTTLSGVELRAGYVPLPDVAALMSSARLVVLPYRRGSQSGVAHLAYTFARPVVAAAVGDIPAVVRDGESGLLVPPEDPVALSEAIVDLLREPLRAARLGAEGCRSLARGATWDEVADRVLAGLPSRPAPATQSGRSTP